MSKNQLKVYNYGLLDDALFQTIALVINNDWNQRSSEITVVKDSPNRKIYKINKGKEVFYLKYYSYQRLSKRIKNLFRPVEAVRSFKISNALVNSRLPVAAPIAAIAVQKSLSLKESYFVMKGCNGLSLQDFLKTYEQKKVVLDKLAELLTAFFSNNFYHGDLNLNNILIDHDLKFSFIDVDNIKKLPFLSWRRVKRNLANFNAHMYAAFDYEDHWPVSYAELEDFFCTFLKKYKPQEDTDQFIQYINKMTAKALINWGKTHLINERKELARAL